MSGLHPFNRITFHVPAERFIVRALISHEERLPVVTEYIPASTPRMPIVVS